MYLKRLDVLLIQSADRKIELLNQTCRKQQFMYIDELFNKETMFTLFTENYCRINK